VPRRKRGRARHWVLSSRRRILTPSSPAFRRTCFFQNKYASFGKRERVDSNGRTLFPKEGKKLHHWCFLRKYGLLSSSIHRLPEDTRVFPKDAARGEASLRTPKLQVEPLALPSESRQRWSFFKKEEGRPSPELFPFLREARPPPEVKLLPFLRNAGNVRFERSAQQRGSRQRWSFPKEGKKLHLWRFLRKESTHIPYAARYFG